MKNIFKLILTGLFAALLLNSTFAQDNIIYNMSNLHQSINDNPARQSKCKVFIGLPVLNHTYIDIVNEGFSYKNIFSEQTDGSFGNIEQIYENINDVNYINFESNISLFKLGFWVKDFYFTTGINNHIYNRISIPKTLLDIKDGNYRPDGTPLSFSNIGENFNVYNEITFGLSNEIIPNLTVGANAKLLFGLANFTTETFQIDWSTDTDPTENFAYTFDTQFDFRASLPISWDATYDEVTNLPNGLDYDTTFVDNIANYKSSDYISLMLPKQNFGLGVDLGAIYEINKYFTVSASIIDFGFIKWKQNSKIITQDAQFEFTGADPAPYIQSFEYMVDSFSVIMDDYTNDFLDTLIGLAEPTFTSTSYKTRLNTKFYIGGSYQPKEWLNLGLLYRGYYWQKKLHSSVTISATANFWRGWSASTSYSIYNGLFNNIGFGLASKIGPFQVYAVADNIAIPIYASNKALQIALNGETSPNFATKLIKNTKEVTLHFGFNLLFGCKNKIDYGILD